MAVLKTLCLYRDTKNPEKYTLDSLAAEMEPFYFQNKSCIRNAEQHVAYTKALEGPYRQIHEFIHTTIAVARMCPVCSKVGLWDLKTVPHIDPETGHLTFYEPGEIILDQTEEARQAFLHSRYQRPTNHDNEEMRDRHVSEMETVMMSFLARLIESRKA
jgi:hypothetical protein